MYNIEVHNWINQIISLYTFIGLLHTDDRTNFRKVVSNIINLCGSVYIPISVLTGSFMTDDKTESILGKAESVAGFVISVRLFYFMRKKDEILNFVRVLGVLSVRDPKVFKQVNTKINDLMKFSKLYHSSSITGIIVWVIVSSPVVSLGKEFLMNVYFPMNYKESVTCRWIAVGFSAWSMTIFTIYSSLNTIIWYLMMCCAIKYQILGNELRNINVVTDTKIERTKNLSLSSVDKNKDVFRVTLIALIKRYQDLRKTTAQVTSCFSNLFFIQIATSGLLICGSVYAIAFNSVTNPIQHFIYVGLTAYIFFDIFMITYFGNEISFWSSNLSYCLFECNWVDQSRYNKQCMIILAEHLKQPQVLLVGKLYRLDLEIFSKILNFAYRMFNVLKNFK